MYKIKPKDVIKIQCYKHDGSVHREWNKSMVLEITDDFVICGNEFVRVTESDGRKWTTKEPAILFFYKKNWFNIIVQFKERGIYYYCNIASPFVFEEKTLKYIDYDLDLRVFPDNKYKVLDKGEYKYHREKMNYPDSIDKIVNSELELLINMFKNKKGPFLKENVEKYHEIYVNFKKK